MPGDPSRKLRRLWDADIMGIVTARLPGTVLEANDTFLRTLGYARADIDAGRIEWGALTPPEWVETYTAMFAELVREGSITGREMELFHADGHRVPVLVGAAMLAQEPEEAECLAFVVDITKRKQLEAQLLQAQRLESVGLLAGGIAHDLNNVLSAILLNGECAQMSLRPDDPVRSDLEEIRHAAESARGITQQLLAFSRQQVLQPQVVELGGVCLGIEKMLRRLLGDDVQLVVETHATRPVLADLGQLEQVLLNLAVNARDAMPGGGVLSIDVRDLDVPPELPDHVLPSGAYVELRVRDPGTGMDAATMARIFEPFFTTKEKGRGTGLGLSTVFGIVKQSGGSIWADSVLGRGTTFHVVLPVASSRPPRARRGTERSPQVAGRGETILVVDDEQAIGRSLRRVLERAGYHVVVVSSPGDALLVAERDGAHIDLLLTDVVMPLMSGPQLSLRLSRMLPHLRTLFMTGYADHAALDPDAPLDTRRTLAKPFSATEVLSRVRDALEQE